MPSYLLGFLVLLAAFILQTTIAPHIDIRGVQPDFILIVVVTCAFIEGPAIGSVAGFFGGLLHDLVLTQIVGIHALCKTIVGYVAGLVERTIFAESIFLPMAAIFLASLLNQLIYAVVIFLLGYEVPFLMVLMTIVIPSAFYNSLLTPLVYPVVCRLATP
ncbi:MAG: rod shape-determining protein MreD [Actinomycetota bacterium]|nr:rod shape-determining protein MreD [Actinomycetota bacterium]MDI6821965.1 rod shape-determining protein MreD [Actinomycetota bacterium]